MSEERERDGDKTLFQGFPFDDSVLNIIPLQKNSKKPAIPWKEYQHKKFPREQLPLKGNFAVVCGEISDFLWILDHDAPPLFSLFKDIDTRTVKTPRGYHQLFKSKEPVKREIKVLGYPIDILGEGSYAVTPPSVVDGKTYHVINHSPILEATPDEIMKRLSKKERDFENPDFKAKVERFKNRVSISNVISSFLNKEHDAGSYWTSKCPFHNDQHASFSVNDEKNYWHCFAGCGGGSLIDFYMKLKDVDFKGAVHELAEMLLQPAE